MLTGDLRTILGSMWAVNSGRAWRKTRTVRCVPADISHSLAGSQESSDACRRIFPSCDPTPHVSVAEKENLLYIVKHQ